MVARTSDFGVFSVDEDKVIHILPTIVERKRCQCYLKRGKW